MQFGRYAYSTDGKTAAPIHWTRICETEDDALYLADDVLDLLPYDASPRIRAWPDCALRAWLNGAFLAAAFTPEEQAFLLPVTLKTAASALLTVQPGLTAEDRIFLLDEREIGLYLRSPELRQTRLTPPRKRSFRTIPSGGGRAPAARRNTTAASRITSTARWPFRTIGTADRWTVWTRMCRTACVRRSGCAKTELPATQKNRSLPINR